MKGDVRIKTRAIDAGEKNFPSITPVLLVSIFVAIAIPPLVFAIVAISKGMGIGETATALMEQYFAERRNLAVLSLTGVIPIMLLALVLWVLGRFKRLRAARRDFAVGGSFGVLAVLLWVNAEFWPTFLPERTYAGFPHGIEFVVGPLIFAPIAMVIGMVTARFVSGRNSTNVDS